MDLKPPRVGTEPPGTILFPKYYENDLAANVNAAREILATGARKSPFADQLIRAVLASESLLR